MDHTSTDGRVLLYKVLHWVEEVVLKVEEVVEEVEEEVSQMVGVVAPRSSACWSSM